MPPSKAGRSMNLMGTVGELNTRYAVTRAEGNKRSGNTNAQEI